MSLPTGDKVEETIDLPLPLCVCVGSPIIDLCVRVCLINETTVAVAAHVRLSACESLPDFTALIFPLPEDFPAYHMHHYTYMHVHTDKDTVSDC